MDEEEVKEVDLWGSSDFEKIRRRKYLNTMEFLLTKRPKEEIITYFLKLVDGLFSTTESLAEFSETVAVYVQANEVLKGNSRVMDFPQPIRNKIQEQVSKARAS